MIYHLKNILRNATNKNKLIAKTYKLANRVKVRLLSGVSDERFAKQKYKENTGKTLNLVNPLTFNEKLWWLKINNRDPLMTQCSDKVSVREYVTKKGLQDILVPVVGIYDKAEDIDFSRITDKVIIKTNHGSGRNIIWDKDIPFDRGIFLRSFNKALTENYFLQSREWNYKDIQPKLIIEKLLVDNPQQSLADYRFLCFDGKVKLLFIDVETAAADGTHYPYAKRNVYDKNFSLLSVKVSRETFDPSRIKKPENFDKMIQIAESLSEPFVFARVDLYNVEGKIFFGEITFYPGGCTQIFEPEEYERMVGSWIDLNSTKIRKRHDER